MTEPRSLFIPVILGWLLGPFITAYFKVNGNNVQDEVREWLETFSGHLTEACLGHVSEILDGDPPHHPRGCAAQAWSVAETLRAAVELVSARIAKGASIRE